MYVCVCACVRMTKGVCKHMYVSASMCAVVQIKSEITNM